jgi:hypothetical protein
VAGYGWAARYMHGTCLDDDPEPETAAEGNRLKLPRVSLAASGLVI